MSENRIEAERLDELIHTFATLDGEFWGDGPEVAGALEELKLLRSQIDCAERAGRRRWYALIAKLTTLGNSLPEGEAREAIELLVWKDCVSSEAP